MINEERRKTIIDLVVCALSSTLAALFSGLLLQKLEADAQSFFFNILIVFLFLILFPNFLLIIALPARRAKHFFEIEKRIAENIIATVKALKKHNKEKKIISL